MCAQWLSHVQLLATQWLYLPRLLCPWDFPGKNTGVGCHYLLLGIFPTQGSNPGLLHWQADSLPLSHQGGPNILHRSAILFLILSKGNENVYPHKDLYTNVPNSFIHNSQKLETVRFYQQEINELGRTMWCKSTHDKKKRTNCWHIQNRISKFVWLKKKSDIDEYVHYDSIYMKL